MLFLLILIYEYLLTAIGLTPSDSSTADIYTQTIRGTTQLTFGGRNYFFFNFSTACILNVNNTGTKQVRIMKQTAF